MLPALNNLSLRILFAYISPLKPRESFKTAENVCINHLFKDHTRSYVRGDPIYYGPFTTNQKTVEISSS
jgi:hypothetical protein